MKTDTQSLRKTIGIKRAVRKICGEHTNCPVTETEGKSAPKSAGSYYWKTNFVAHGGRFRKILYTPSSRRVEVGKEWDAIAPKGCFFRMDYKGIAVIRTSDGMDYHPSANDFRAPNFATVVREGMAENFKRRAAQRKVEKQAARTAKEKAAREKMIARDLRNTRVTLDDSRKVGNCVEGTLAFCERKLGLSREEILSGGYMLTVSADRLAARANGDIERVNAAIYRAWIRETTVCI